MYAPTIEWDFQNSFSNTVLHVEEALPGIFLLKLCRHLNETNHYQIPSFIRITGNFFGTFHRCTLHYLTLRSNASLHQYLICSVIISKELVQLF